MALSSTGKAKGAYSYILSFSWARAIATLGVLYFGSLLLIICIARRLPAKESLLLPGEGGAVEQLTLKVPASFAELRDVRHTLDVYRRACPWHMTLLLLAIYMFCQVFMMPGSSFLNVLAGSLFGTAAAIPLVAVISTIGASGSYLLSRLVVKDVVVGLFPERVAAFSRVVAAQRPQLLAYLIAARITPVIPSWFINLASPILQIPFRQFLASTAIGLQPSNILFVQAGASIGNLHSWRDLYGPRSITLLALCMALALLPVLIRRRMPKAHIPAPLLPLRSAALADAAHAKSGAPELESPRRGTPLVPRTHSLSGGVLSRQHLAVEA